MRTFYLPAIFKGEALLLAIIFLHFTLITYTTPYCVNYTLPSAYLYCPILGQFLMNETLANINLQRYGCQ